MSHGDGPPPIFEEDDFPYWKIRMEAYLEALDVGIFRVVSQGFPRPKDHTHLPRPLREAMKNNLVGDSLKMMKIMYK